MLPSLYIKNFRIFSEFRIPSLGKINLLTGKNNTGKTALLEAIALYASRGDLNLILNLLSERGESIPISAKELFDLEKDVFISTLKTLFYNNRFGFGEDDKIFISAVSEKELVKNNVESDFLSMRFFTWEKEISEGPDRESVIYHRKINIISQTSTPDDFIGYEILSKDGARYIFYENDHSLSKQHGSIVKQNVQFFKTNSNLIARNSILWDEITLTEKEKEVIQALQIIEPQIERIAFVGENYATKKAVVKLTGSYEVVPLLRMGDGINRILSFILAIVNAENGFCLIDEFENGLHYSVQKDLWKTIFHLSERLNIQIFATTHSQDSIYAFSEVASEYPHFNGKLFRLDNIKGKIQCVEYSPEEALAAKEFQIETR
ncbi:MAG: AAA family ATPase [Chitinophagaceae bacterium]|nr:AAA family ATPase [Chitinophagaceae bacterium]